MTRWSRPPAAAHDHAGAEAIAHENRRSLRPAAGHLAGRPRGDRRDRGRSDATAARGTLPFTFPSSDPFAFLARAPGIRWPTGQINSPIESPWEAHHGYR